MDRRALLRPLSRALTPVAGRMPWLVLVETLGRRTRLPRRTPVSNGLDGDTLWAVAEHGRRADWVRNLEATPLVRVRVAGRWRAGTGRVLAAEDPEPHRRRLDPVNAAAVRAVGTELTTVRIDLEPPAPEGDGEVAVDGIVAAPPPAVYAFLEDLGNHGWIADRFLEVVDVQRDAAGHTSGARLRLHSPLAPTRDATTTVTTRHAPHGLEGVVEIPGVGRAAISWELAALGGGTRVRLTTRSLETRPVDRAWFRVFGAAWLRRRYDAILTRLARRLAAEQASG